MGLRPGAAQRTGRTGPVPTTSAPNLLRDYYQLTHCGTSSRTGTGCARPPAATTRPPPLLAREGVAVWPHTFERHQDEIAGYSVPVADWTNAAGKPVRFGGRQARPGPVLAQTDLYRTVGADSAGHADRPSCVTIRGRSLKRGREKHGDPVTHAKIVTTAPPRASVHQPPRRHQVASTPSCVSGGQPIYLSAESVHPSHMRNVGRRAAVFLVVVCLGSLGLAACSDRKTAGKSSCASNSLVAKTADGETDLATCAGVIGTDPEKIVIKVNEKISIISKNSADNVTFKSSGSSLILTNATTLLGRQVGTATLLETGISCVAGGDSCPALSITVN